MDFKESPMKRRVFLQGVSATAGGLAFPAIALGQQYKAEYKMSTVLPTAFAWGKGGEIFCNLVREGTNGRINIKQYPGSSLVQGDQTREFSAMRQGVIDVLCGAPVNWYSSVRQLSIFTLPFITPNYKALDAVLANQAFMNEYFDIVRKAGAEPVGVGETGFRQISNSKRPIIKPDDMKGIKVRVIGSPMYGEIMSSMGANPTFMSWADAQPALASNAVDAQENPLELFLTAKLHTLGQKFVTKWNYSNDIMMIAIANDQWRNWSAQDQKIVRECGVEAARQQIALVRKMFAEDVDKVKALGVDVHVPTPAETLEWQTATRRVYSRWKAQINPGLISKMEQIIDEALKKA
jgi:TRAP-type C4-dicarboxylate transport system substrate-binding protein